MHVSPQPGPSAAAARERRLIGGLSHDLRSPLNSIIGFADLLQSQLADSLSDKHRRFLGNISSSARDLLSLVDLVVDVALVDERDPLTHGETVSLAEIIRRCAQLTLERAERRGVAIRPALADAHDQTLRTDSARLVWALVQIVDHAVDALGSHGDIRVERAPGGDDRTAAIRIVATLKEPRTDKSTGRGVDPPEPRIKEAIRLLRQLDGHVEYDGTAGGGGFLYRVTFPVVADAPGKEYPT